MNIKKYKAVIFDLDGTLVDSMWIWKDIDNRYLKEQGYELPDDLQKKIEGMSTTETAHYFKKTFNIKEDIESIKAEWLEMAREYYAHKIELKKGALPFLKQLHSEGIKIGIGTSNFRTLAQLVLEKHKITHYFDTLRTSCEFEHGKPAPDVFLAVAKDLGVLPSECLVFEDTHAGVIAAKRANMDVIGIKDQVSIHSLPDIKKDAMKVIDDFNACIK